LGARSFNCGLTAIPKRQEVFDTGWRTQARGRQLPLHFCLILKFDCLVKIENVLIVRLRIGRSRCPRHPEANFPGNWNVLKNRTVVLLENKTFVGGVVVGGVQCRAFRSRSLREKLRLTTVTPGHGGASRGGGAEPGFIEELFQGWKYICRSGEGRLKRFHFSETEHVAVRSFIDVFISGALNPRRCAVTGSVRP
jgi:hypothetical protein